MSTLYKNHAAEVWGETITLTVAATIAVILRFIARKISPASFWWDDWTIIISLIFNYGLSSMFWLQTRNYGLGRHAVLLSEEDLKTFWKSFLAVEIVYFCNSAATKTSLILLYYRIFGVVRQFRIALIVAETIVASYFTACVLTSILGCHPVAFFWDASIVRGRCINRGAFFRYNGVANLCTDFMILCLTMPMVWRLKINFRQKVTLSSIFLLGTFVCIASIVRVTSFDQFDAKDPLYTTVLTSVWSSVEQSLGIVCACLPVLRPLFHRVSIASLTGWKVSEDRGTTDFARLHEDNLNGNRPPDQLIESILLQPTSGSTTTQITNVPAKDFQVSPQLY